VPTRVSYPGFPSEGAAETTYEDFPSARLDRPRLIARVLARREALAVRAVLRIERGVDVAHRVEQAAYDTAVLLVRLGDSSVLEGRVPSRGPNSYADSGVGLEGHVVVVVLLEGLVEMVRALGVGELYHWGHVIFLGLLLLEERGGVWGD